MGFILSNLPGIPNYILGSIGGKGNSGDARIVAVPQKIAAVLVVSSAILEKIPKR
jgi:hypothetical protein